MNEKNASNVANTSNENGIRMLTVEECAAVSGGANPIYIGGGGSGTNPLYRPGP